MDKKGILAGETLKIILAVLGIVVLFGLAIALYGMFFQSDITKAKVHMDNIDRIINGLKEGDSADYIILNPSGWTLSTWPIAYTEESPVGNEYGSADSNVKYTYLDSDLPKECKKNGWKECICLCQFSGSYTYLYNCNLASICKEIKVPLEKVAPISIQKLIDNKKAVDFKISGGKLVMSSK